MKLRTERRRVLKRDARREVTDVLWRVKYRIDATPDEIAVMEFHYFGDDLILANDRIGNFAEYVAGAGDFSWSASDLVGAWVHVPSPIGFDRVVQLHAQMVRACEVLSRKVAIGRDFEGESSVELGTGPP